MRTLHLPPGSEPRPRTALEALGSAPAGWDPPTVWPPGAALRAASRLASPSRASAEIHTCLSFCRKALPHLVSLANSQCPLKLRRHAPCQHPPTSKLGVPGFSGSTSPPALAQPVPAAWPQTRRLQGRTPVRPEPGGPLQSCRDAQGPPPGMVFPRRKKANPQHVAGYRSLCFQKVRERRWRLGVTSGGSSRRQSGQEPTDRPPARGLAPAPYTGGQLIWGALSLSPGQGSRQRVGPEKVGKECS